MGFVGLGPWLSGEEPFCFIYKGLHLRFHLGASERLRERFRLRAAGFAKLEFGDGACGPTSRNRTTKPYAIDMVCRGIHLLRETTGPTQLKRRV